MFVFTIHHVSHFQHLLGIQKPTRFPKPNLVPTPNDVLGDIDYMLKFMIPFIENFADLKGDGYGFWGIAEFLGLTEESHIMVRRHIIQEVKDHRNNYVQVFESEDRINYVTS